MLKFLKPLNIVIIVFTVAVCAWVSHIMLIDSKASATSPDAQTDPLSMDSGIQLAKKAASNIPSNSQQNSPLIDEARQFIDRLYPKEVAVETPTTRVNPATRITTTPSGANKRPKGTGKFEVLGTCVSSDPNRSLVFVKVSGKGNEWLRQGQTFGRGVVTKVEADHILFSEGGKDLKLYVPQQDSPKLLKVAKEDTTDSRGPSVFNATTLPVSSSTTALATNSQLKPTPRRVTRVMPTPIKRELTQEEKEKIAKDNALMSKEITSKLKEMGLTTGELGLDEESMKAFTELGIEIQPGEADPNITKDVEPAEPTE